MPYNNTPITPSKEATGSVSLPLARVKKIINVDPDIAQCSNNAAFLITLATELFLQHLVEQAFNQVKGEHAVKARRNVQYRDVANAVSRVENLEFLTDVVPKTTTFKQAKQRQHLALREAQTGLLGASAASAAAAQLGQRTLDSAGKVVVPVLPAAAAPAPAPGMDIMDVVEGGGGDVAAAAAAARRDDDGEDEEEEGSGDEEMS